jgi:hypothetical protein
MKRQKHPLEYELIPDTLEKGDQWLTLRLKNVGDVILNNLDIKMHSADSLQIAFPSPGTTLYAHSLNPGEEKFLSFHVDAYGTTNLYLSIRYFKGSYFNGVSSHWDSPWISEQVLANVAELERVLMSNSHGIIGRELEVEATIKGLDNTEGLNLQFWLDTPSGIYEEIAQIKTKSLSNGEEASYTAKIIPKEKGYYTVYASLYDNHRRISRDSDTIWVVK